MAFFSQLAGSLRKQKSSLPEGRRSRQEAARTPSTGVFASPAASVHGDLDFNCAGDRSSRSSRFFATLSRASTSLGFLTNSRSNQPKRKHYQGLYGSASDLNLPAMQQTDTATQSHGKSLFSAKRFKRFSRHKPSSTSVLRHDSCKKRVESSQMPTPDLSLRGANVEIIQDVTKAFEGNAQQCPTLRGLDVKKHARPALDPSLRPPPRVCPDMDPPSDAETLVALPVVNCVGNASPSQQRPEEPIRSTLSTPVLATTAVSHADTPTLGSTELPPTRPQSQVDWHIRSPSVGTLMPDDSTSVKGYASSCDLTRDQTVAASSFYGTPAEPERMSIISSSPDALAGLEWLRLEESSLRLKMVFDGAAIDLNDNRYLSDPTFNEGSTLTRVQTPLCPMVASPESTSAKKPAQRVVSPFSQGVLTSPRPKRPSLSVDISSKRLAAASDETPVSKPVLRDSPTTETQAYSLPQPKPLLHISPEALTYTPSPIRSRDPNTSTPLSGTAGRKKLGQRLRSPFSSSPMSAQQRVFAQSPTQSQSRASTISHANNPSCDGTLTSSRTSKPASPRGMHDSADRVLRQIHARCSVRERSSQATYGRPGLGLPPGPSSGLPGTSERYAGTWQRNKRPMISIERYGTIYDAGMF
ncbi:hypothetical protein BCR37DRAFT_391855 [Protomyces lactucae-debilis]|uniref:Uncharacterized protein n=1 Tax=Protomyces lactucae-debilis TaxID=2754530 RepID=A0A1Y2FK00_PROLT|nr:uncharacterized protein BCR37DRAFT_391855 [Protomyces lactucae-debilis]ORY84259.1 hypothetical protein BCR37DRAFT_391855 [Protomyces lactucae-debilis]